MDLDDEPVPSRLRRRYQEGKTYVGTADARRRLDVFGDVGRHSGEGHRVEGLDVDAMRDS
jgi:hypothetical protein